MNINKKLAGLLAVLGCVLLLLSACRGSEEKPQPTQPTEAATTTQPTEEVPTELPTEEATEAPTEETTEEPTEAPTEPQGSSGVGSNTGTGGGYAPQEPQEPTQPETTEAVEVPQAGAEGNPYYEYLPQAPDSFTTVKLQADAAVYYTVKATGAYLQVASDDVNIVFDEKTYQPEEGLVQLPLPEDAQAVALQLINRGKQAQSFAVCSVEAEGKKSNPIQLTALELLEFAMDADSQDGVFYTWTATENGVLTMELSKVEPAARMEVTVAVGSESYQLSESAEGVLEIPIRKDDQLLIQVQVQPDADGKQPAVSGSLSCAVVAVQELTVDQIPSTVQTESIAAGDSVYYSISGVDGAMVSIASADAAATYDGNVYCAESGVVAVEFKPGDGTQPVTVKLTNTGSVAQAFQMEFGYPLGHRQNPQILTQLGVLEVAVKAGTYGYYYSYTPEQSGAAIFTVATAAEGENTKTDITLTNVQTEATAQLWADGILQENVMLELTAGQELLICVQVTDPYTFSDLCIDAQVTVEGQLNACIPVAYPGFEAAVGAGESKYYEGTNLQDTTFCLLGENVRVIHNGVSYIPGEGKLTFPVVCQGREPVQFVIENLGQEDAVYPVTFTYPVGHMMNPAPMALGSSFVNQPQGASEFCFNYTAQKDGQVVFEFDPQANWVYTVDNLTAQVYGDLQFSDSEPAMPVATVAAQQGDVIQIRVNTYDPADPFTVPEGTVAFTASLVTTAQQITDLSQSFTTTVLGGETAQLTGKLQGAVITVENAQDITLSYNGENYSANEAGQITMTFLDPANSDLYSFTLHNHNSESWDCSIAISYVPGGPLDPGELLLGEGSASNSQNGVGYWFRYIAPKDGQLQVAFDPESNWQCAVNGGQILHSDDGQGNLAQAYVQAGEPVLVWISTYDPENATVAPEGAVEFEATLISSPVTLENLTQAYPTELLFYETAQFTGELRNVIVTVENAHNMVAMYNGQEFLPNIRGNINITLDTPDSDGAYGFSLLNMGQDGNCNLTFSGITGCWLSPDWLILGQNTVELEKDAADYYYSYTAPKDGILELSFQGTGWQYTVENLTSGAGQQTGYSDTDSAVIELEVAEGDQVLLYVNTYEPADPDALPAGTVSFAATLITEPVQIEALDQIFRAPVLAGETACFYGELRNVIVTVSGAADAVITYNGTEYTCDEQEQIQVTICEPDSEGVWGFSLKNGEEDCNVTMRFAGLPGHWMNPDVLKLGENSITQEAGAPDYYYSYTAPKAGVLTIAFDPNSHWSYSLNEQDRVFSTDADGHLITLEVAENDEIHLVVNTYDPASSEATPAGEVALEAGFLTGPVQITDLSQPMIVSLLAGETLQLSGALAGETLTVVGAEGLTLIYDGAEHLPEDGVLSFTFPASDSTQPLRFMLHNSSQADSGYSLSFGAETGTADNPAELLVGTNVATCQAGSDGYYYKFTATARNYTLRLVFTAGTNWKVVYKGRSFTSETTSVSGNTQTLNLGKLSAIGTELDIIVMTYDPDNPDSVPSGSVEFEVTYKK